jgi:hypothetical protein
VPSTIVVSGDGGTVRWGYHVAATLGAWTFDGAVVQAQVDSYDPVRVTQSGLTFEVQQMNRPPMVRPVIWIQVTDGAATLRLGPKG